jgi:hypothetical protein
LRGEELTMRGSPRETTFAAVIRPVMKPATKASLLYHYSEPGVRFMLIHSSGNLFRARRLRRRRRNHLVRTFAPSYPSRDYFLIQRPHPIRESRTSSTGRRDSTSELKRGRRRGFAWPFVLQRSGFSVRSSEFDVPPPAFAAAFPAPQCQTEDRRGFSGAVTPSCQYPGM